MYYWRPAFVFAQTHTLVDKDNTEWSDDQNNIRAEEACRAHKTGKIKKYGWWRGVAHNKEGMKSWNDYHRLLFLLFFLRHKLMSLILRKVFFKFFFSLFKALFIPIRTKHGRHNLTQGTWKRNHKKHGTYIYSHNKLKKKEKKKQNQLHVFDVIGTKQRQVRKKSAVLVPTAHARQW